MPNHVALDLSGARRVLVGGDVHGHLPLLLAALERAEYDPAAGDALILLGDLVDRGDDVLEIRDWLAERPDVIVLRGNHEDMLLATLGLERMDALANPYTLLRNGGEWIRSFMPGRRRADPLRLANRLLDAGAKERRSMFDPELLAWGRVIAERPIAVTARTPGGATIGLVHGDVAGGDWNRMIAGLEHPDPVARRDAVRSAMWDRVRFDAVRHARQTGRPDPEDVIVEGVDHVFHGHSITREPMTAGNVSWIDTGSYKTGLVTIVDVDAWPVATATDASKTTSRKVAKGGGGRRRAR